MAPAALAVFGALLTALAGFWMASRNVETARQRAEFEKQLREKSDEIAALARDTAAKSDEIAKLNTEIAALVTGGDSIPIVDFVDAGLDRPNYVILSVVNQGRYPLFDVVVNVIDLVAAEAAKKANPTSAPYAVLQSMFQKSIGTAVPQQAVMLQNDPVPLPDGGYAALEIRVTARNGVVNQIVRFERVDGRWTFATQATKDGVVIYQRLSEQFPVRGVFDQPRWWFRGS